MRKRAGVVCLGLCALMTAAAPLRAQAPAAGAGAATTAPLALGTPAPNVSLLINGKTLPLKGLLAGNRTLILFYPAACASCDSQLQAVDKDVIQSLGKMGFALFAVSPDLPADQAKTVGRLSLPYTVLSDPGGAAARAFHVAGSAAFLIDADGAVRFVSSASLAGSDIVAAAAALKRSSRAKS